MPPRHVYWTILVDGMPTAFRAHSRDELLPTLRQLQTKHPDAVLKWFARGKLWESDEEERAARTRRPWDGERRGRDWRPGGEHKDPRDRFKVPRDVKRQRFKARAQRERIEGNKPGNARPDAPSRAKRPWNPEGQHERRPGWKPRDESGRPRGDRPPWNRNERPRDQQGERREWNPEDRQRGQQGRREWKPEHREQGPRSKPREWNREQRPEGGQRPPRREWNREQRPERPRDDFRDRKPGGPGGHGPRRPPFGGPSDGRPAGGPPSSRRPFGERPHGGRSPGGRPPGGRPPGGRPSGRGWRNPGGGKKGGGGRGR